MEQSVQDQHMLAAIDLGSNSFHMVLARVINGQIQIIDQRGEKVQLAAGLHPINGISEDAQQRALDCLERFAEPLRGLKRHQVVALGTNTLRAGRNSREFIQRATAVLGFPIEVISGIEEARLVYLGVAHTLADEDGRRLVIDIGGGSTEFIIGDRFKPMALESLHMGCVTYSDRYFANGNITDEGFNKAIAAAQNALMTIKARYKFLGWENVVGSSGTIRATSRVLQNYGLSESGIHLKALLRLKKLILQSSNVSELELQGVKEQRLNVFPAGVAILIAIFNELDIDTMSYSEGALREGALHDLIGREKHEDVREITVAAMQDRFVVDTVQANKVKRTAINLYQQVAKKWKLDEPEYEGWLRWACDLHEVGLAIAHNHYNRHSSYLVQNSDMSGFTRETQDTLSLLLRYQRKKLIAPELDDMPKRGRRIIMRLIILLRLSILLHRGRGIEEVIEPEMKVSKYTIELIFPEHFGSNHPMTIMDLEEEKSYLDAVCYELKFQ